MLQGEQDSHCIWRPCLRPSFGKDVIEDERFGVECGHCDDWAALRSVRMLVF
jgi:hypothetical protein